MECITYKYTAFIFNKMANKWGMRSNKRKKSDTDKVGEDLLQKNKFHVLSEYVTLHDQKDLMAYIR